MYIPKPFQVTDRDEIFSFIESNSFGQIISNGDGRLVSTHMPFLVTEDRTKIIGHLAKQNQHSEALEGQEVLITLQGPHDYISPSWYHDPGVPTWNYQAAHIYGQCSLFYDLTRLSGVIDTLTRKYEAAFEKPWQVEYSKSILQAVVGVEVTISDIECKYKLGQNRSTRDQKQVVEQLKLKGSNALAEATEQVQIPKVS